MLDDILDLMENEAYRDRVSIGAIIDAAGRRSLAVLLLIPALITVSPLSGIPGVPTLNATLIVLIAVQILIGNDTVWVPQVLRRQSVNSVRFRRAISAMRKPVGWVDPMVRERLTFLTDGIAAYLALLICVFLALTMPPLEILPFMASLTGITISLLVLGIIASDGVLVVAGYTIIAGTVAALIGIF